MPEFKNNAKYWYIRRILKEYGYRIENGGGYKAFRYGQPIRYNVVNEETKDILIRYKTVNQIYDILVGAKIIEE